MRRVLVIVFNAVRKYNVLGGVESISQSIMRLSELKCYAAKLWRTIARYQQSSPGGNNIDQLWSGRVQTSNRLPFQVRNAITPEKAKIIERNQAKRFFHCPQIG